MSQPDKNNKEYEPRRMRITKRIRITKNMSQPDENNKADKNNKEASPLGSALSALLTHDRLSCYL